MRAALGLGVIVGSIIALAGCAGSRAPGQPDGGSPAPAPDAAPPPVIDAPPPSEPGRPVGDPCTSSEQCASHICVVVASGGVCSELCTDSSTCPDPVNDDCVLVSGAGPDGNAASVCVPKTSQLCTVCQQDSECTLVGMDKCLTEDTGRSYCSRDCSTIGCPDGFACMDEVIDHVNYKQCVPTSQACDCRTADQAGATDACSITTPLNTQCAGSRTCGGPAGWSACQPPSATDVPDGDYKDDNCDGIDGDATQGIFVSTSGANTLTCGTTVSQPCQTINAALDRAVATGRPNLYVQAGAYHEVVVLRSGVSIWGGYDISWQRGPVSAATHKVTIIGQQDTAGDNEYLAVRARDLTAPVTIADLAIQGPDAQGVGGASGRDGRSSYAIHAKGAALSLVRVQLIAGSGAAGATGAPGADAPVIAITPLMNGGAGGDGNQGTSACEDTSRGAGGTAGTNQCAPSTVAPAGGAGGRGGTKDKNCPLDFTATPGDPGKPAAVVQVPFGTAGTAGTGGNSCLSAGPGNGGMFHDGTAGGGGTGGYLAGAQNLYWYAHAGSDGTRGENGTGGGGGGGAGGCDNGTDSWGGGGGGGGAGGCA
ncbi:MAG TPA: hypothetical protein VFP84_20545, partial [Kofleriaceae bacterium]|nr:hypothetical protein [Kofleriaceae bacterium]